MQSTWSPQDEAVAAREQAKLDASIKATGPQTPKEPRQGVGEARHASSVVTPTTGRTATRLLLVTTDTTLLNQATTSLDGYVALSEVFDEVHVLVMRTGIPAKAPVLRVADNVWLYVATSPSRWSSPQSAWKLIKEQFIFADGFRPDLIVARDPFESAAVAYYAGRSFGRPIQLHLSTYCDDIKVPKRYTRLERLVANILIPRFPSVRTITDEDVEQLRTWWPQIVDVATLPRYRDIAGLASRGRSTILAKRFPQFSFFIMYVGDLGYGSTAFRAIDAARAALQNPRVGMVIIGDGPARDEFIKRTELLSLKEHIVFERKVDNIHDYLLSADVLLVTDTTAAGDDWCVAAGAAGTPIVATSTAVRLDLFSSGDTACLTDPTDVTALERGVMQLLNDSALRLQRKEAAQQKILTRVHDNPEEYKRAYRASVEEAILVVAET